MNKNKIRIFTYLPNPRIWKSLIAADLNNIDKPENGTAFFVVNNKVA